jgi:hypothetical protein
VRSEVLTSDAILSAIERGDFYASTGVTISEIQANAEEYRVVVEPATTWNEKITTWFIGDGGKILGKTFDKNAVYQFTGSEKYVRARVESSGGAKAWTQPVFRTANSERAQ